MGEHVENQTKQNENQKVNQVQEDEYKLVGLRVVPLSLSSSSTKQNTVK